MCTSTERSKTSKSRSATSSSRCSRGLHAAASAREAQENLEFDRRQRQRLPVERGRPCIRIHPQRADRDRGGARRAALARGDPGTANHGSQAGQQFARGEGLRQIIVGADFEARDAVRLIAKTGQHQHRHGGFFAQTLQQLESVQPRQHHVEDHARRGVRPEPGPSLRDRCSPRRRDSPRVRGKPSPTAQLAVVLDQQQMRAFGMRIGHILVAAQIVASTSALITNNSCGARFTLS